ncbi:MAG: tape measure domain-containing protein, partial [Acidobacteria bacterium]|nr:tape measure domain-containing protein [Acidobacteriota bacterium]
ILQDLGRIILQLAFRPVENFLGGLFESIFGGIFGGGRQHGGLVSPSQAFLVGEGGPELFVPAASGRIVPNNQLGGGTVINIDARGADAGVEQRIRRALELTYRQARRDAVIQVEERKLRRGG